VDDEKLPLSGKRWIWILAIIVVIVVLAIAIGSQPASKGVPMGAPVPDSTGSATSGAM
jgi:hypothetical protein